jgi:hypothetical protein
VRDHPDDHLDGHEADDQRECDRERPDGRFRADAVVMVVTGAMGVGHGRSLTVA